MTVNELKAALDEYDGNTDVKVAVGPRIGELCFVTNGVDMDTNTKSVWLCDNNEKYKATMGMDIL